MDSGYVYFDRKDHPGLARRLLSVGIDGIAIVVLNVVAMIVARASGDAGPLVFYSAIVLTLATFIGLKASGVGTPGHWLTGVRLVNYRGKRAGLVRAMFLVLAAPSVFLLSVLDIAWIVVDPGGTTLLDKVFGLYLVNRGARPAGHGHRRWVYYDVNAFQLPCSEIVADAKPGAAAAFA